MDSFVVNVGKHLLYGFDDSYEIQPIPDADGNQLFLEVPIHGSIVKISSDAPVFAININFDDFLNEISKHIPEGKDVFIQNLEMGEDGFYFAIRYVDDM